MKSGTLVYGLAKYSSILVTMLTSAILARLISPEEYGVITVVIAFSSLFAAVADLGLGSAIIQNKNLNETEINDIFSFTFYFALVLGIVFMLLGIPIAHIYQNREYQKICILMSLFVFFSTLNIVPNALILKEKHFHLVAKRLICISCFIGLISTLMAWNDFSYYTIVWQHILQASITFFWNYTKTNIRFHLRFRTSSVALIGEFTTFQSLYYLYNNIARNLDNLLVGKAMGNTSLAFYDKGYRLMLYPVQNLTIVINPILHPILSDYQNDHLYIYKSYVRLAHSLSLIGVFVSLLCFWASEEIVILFYGEQWQEAVSIFRILSLSVWPQIITSSAGSVYQSTNNTRLMFRSGCVYFSLMILFIVIGISTKNLITLAVLVTISQYFRFFIDYFSLVRLNFHLPYSNYLIHFAPETGFALLAFAAIVWTGLTVHQNLFVSLLLKGAILTALYGAFLLCSGLLPFCIFRRQGNEKN